MIRRRKAWGLPFLIAALLTACGPIPAPASNTLVGATSPLPDAVTVAAATRRAPTATPQTTATPAVYGPDAGQFPPNVNPLTGLSVADSSLLKIPAVLVSISHFPATGRPQAGLSFAPFVYEFSITGGETRFLATFYGEFPAPEIPITGNCGVRSGLFEQAGPILGNHVWLDANRNGIRDPGEGGIPRICVRLLDSKGKLIDSTTTDSNGIYGFNAQEGTDYRLHFLRPPYLAFTPQDVGDDNTDSDADPLTGMTSMIRVTDGDMRWDAGLFPNRVSAAPTPDPKLQPKPEVGPVRSGRLLYAYIGGFYQDSCLIYAFASPQVLEKIPHCAFVAHDVVGGGAMLPIDRMRAVAEDNMRHTATRPFDYSSNVYSQSRPPGGFPASDIKVFFGNLDQSGWSYDPLYEAYLRYVDTADPNARGVLHADVDRLTGRQLHFENIVVVMADTDVIAPNNLDIHLDEGNTGRAWLFRDDRVYPIAWSTRAGDYERHTGFRRPIRFVNQDGSPAALKPGHTWVIIVTPFSEVGPQGDGIYSVRYAAPAGEAR